MRVISKLFLVVCLISGGAATGFAQILDDSTKAIYSYRSVGLKSIGQYYVNDTTWYKPDSITPQHERLTPILKAKFAYQDLGNHGTATHFILPQFGNELVGRQLGFRIYEPYKTTGEAVMYYNTRSPYTVLRYVQNGLGHSQFGFIHSQNLTARLNMTADIRRLASSNQINTSGFRESRLIDHWNVTLSTNYQNKSGKYRLAGHYNHFLLGQTEQGGILYTRDLSLFRVDSVALTDARLARGNQFKEIDNRAFLHHDMRLAKGLKVFQEITYTQRKLTFFDPQFKANKAAFTYDGLYNKDTLDTFNTLRTIDNKVGLNGSYRGFYGNLYARQRFYSFKNVKSGGLILPNQFEFLIGGNTTFVGKDTANVVGVSAEINPITLHFGILARASIKGIRLNFLTKRYPAELFYTVFTTPAYSWNKSTEFGSQFTNQLEAMYALSLKDIRIQPVYRLHLLTNYLYFNAAASPMQVSGPILVQEFGGNIQANRAKWYVELAPKLNLSTNPSILPVPAFEVDATIERKLNYAGVLAIDVGLNTHLKTAYYGLGYHPLIHQFVLQNLNKTWGGFMTDIYAKFQLRKVKLAFRYGNLTQSVGNFIPGSIFGTPFYPMLRRTLTMGVEWPLFD